MREDPLEDAVAAAAVTKSVASVAATSAADTSVADNDGRVKLQLSSTPEWRTIGSGALAAFHAIASITIPEDSGLHSQGRRGMDIVCVLDNSGSMSGAKFQYLQHALRFIQSQLTSVDRLSLVTFNHSASCVHGLYRMTPERRAESEALVNSLIAGGGTNIYAGMRSGADVLQQRAARNPITCMFLLTDGQDGSQLAEKKALAAQMKADGTGLFVFGFGADHDSVHLNAIANAAESSFIYVQDSDQVVDAFGGALGSQQGMAAKNIKLNLTAQAAGLLIDQVNAGNYATSIGAGRRSAQVTFANLFAGERRDVLVKMIVPALPSATAVPQYPLFELTADYTPVGGNSTAAAGSSAAPMELHSLEEENSWCTVARVEDAVCATAVPSSRDLDVDAQTRRLQITELLQRALDMGDRRNVDAARTLLSEALADLRAASVAHKAGHLVAMQLERDLEQGISSLRNAEEYANRGGRSMMTEAWSSNVQQRCTYSKGATKNAYQSSASDQMQVRSAMSKGGFK